MTKDDFMDHRCPCGRFYRTCPYHQPRPHPYAPKPEPPTPPAKPKK